MLAALLMLVWVAQLYPRVLMAYAGQAFAALRQVLGI